MALFGGSKSVRPPVMAGRFYPGEPDDCQRQAQEYVRNTRLPTGVTESAWLGGIVPHAGWVCSAAVAAETMVAIARKRRPDLVVVFAAVHTPLPLAGAALDKHARWAVPGADSEVPTEINRRLAEVGSFFRIDDRFHAREHAVEVELPLIQQTFGAHVPVLPIEVAPDEHAPDVGRRVANLLSNLKRTPVFLASSDMTHYGPDYRFVPAGIGESALDWAMENDQRVLDLVGQLADDKIVPETQSRQNACGGGAIAAMVAACKAFGATGAHLIRHTNSFATLFNVAPQPPTNAVGYVSLVLG